MIKHIIFILLIIGSPLSSQGRQLDVKNGDNVLESGNSSGADVIILPINMYDHVQFNEELSDYIRLGLYITGPAFSIIYGSVTWGWDLNKGFTYNPETFFGDDAVHGAADKYGHLYAAYAVKRFSTFLFRATGSSENRANIEGALFSEIIMLGSEIGDGFSQDYGFDPYDLVFNNMGIVIAMILDWSPVLDGLFAVQIEYVPTREMRDKFKFGDNHDLPTDYGGTKFLLSTKFAGIPYVSLTPLRYINLDIGYYSRGFDQKNYKTNTRNLFFGVSINFSVSFGDLLPAGYFSSTLQTSLNYVHIPWDYEIKKYVVSEIAH